jgi:hypothetical protein
MSWMRIFPCFLVAAALESCSETTPVSPPESPNFAAVATTMVFTQPFNETVEAGTCNATTDITLTGQEHVVIQLTERPDGQFNPAPINTTAHGTGVDENGGTYRFNHVNNSILRDKTGAFSLPFTFSFVDVFRLIGKQDAPDGLFVIRATVRINEDESVDFLRLKITGDPSCDPE